MQQSLLERFFPLKKRAVQPKPKLLPVLPPSLPWCTSCL